MHAKNVNHDDFIATLAARQHGVVSLAQLEQAGIRRQGRTSRVRARRLHRIHRGVYAVGHAGLSQEGRWMAAVLAYGPTAVLSHTSAAALWGLLSGPGVGPATAQRPISHVTVPVGTGRSHRAGVRVHRSRNLMADQSTRRFGIPVTTPSRTLADLRRTVTSARYAAALRQAQFLRLPVDAALRPDGTRSELEARFLGLCRRHRLPEPDVNVRVGGRIVDFAWREQQLVVEVDGYRAHGTRAAFEADRARDVRLKLLGYDVLRFTWRQVRTEPKRVAKAVRALLGQASAAG